MINDGGEAFPRAVMTPDGADIAYGMSLRDFFAAKAMGGFLASYHPDATGLAPISDREDIAQMAYAIADAMLAARTAYPAEEDN